MAHDLYVKQVKETYIERERSRESTMKELLYGPVVGQLSEQGNDGVEGIDQEMNEGKTESDKNDVSSTNPQKLSFANITQVLYVLFVTSLDFSFFITVCTVLLSYTVFVCCIYLFVTDGWKLSNVENFW